MKLKTIKKIKNRIQTAEKRDPIPYINPHLQTTQKTKNKKIRTYPPQQTKPR